MKTEREFLNRVYELVSDEEVLSYIDSRLEKLDKANERERAKNTAKNEERLELCKKIVEWQKETHTVLTSAAVADFMSELSGEAVSVAKASALLRFGVKAEVFTEEGDITVMKVNSQGKSSKSKVKSYGIAE